LTLEELARRTGIAASNLSRLERAGSDPRASTLERVLRGLGLRLTTERAVVLTLCDIESRMAVGAGRLERAGTGKRDAAARLEWKERRGADTGVERRLLAGR
jgi:transcriptional regulator with XRE-family HTH domain